MKESKVVNTQDPFGTLKFAEIKAKFGNPTKLSKTYKGRFENIVSVFSHRTNVAHELHHASDQLHWHRAPLEGRLAQFKSAEFFCSALQTLLDEKIKDEATAPIKKKRYTNPRFY